MLMGFLYIWLVTAFGLWVVTWIVPGVRARSGSGLWLLTLPLTVLTFGLFALFINAFTIWLTAALVRDFEVRNFGAALLAALVMALLGVIGLGLLQWLVLDEIYWIHMPAQQGVYL